MSTTVFTPSLQVAVPEMTALAVLFALLSVGVVGMSIRNMFESVLSDDEDGGSGGGDMGGGDLGGLGGDDMGGGDDDMGGGDLGGLGGDDMGGGGGLGGLDGGDDLGGFDDDEFGEMESGANTDELEHRLSELENEVGSLSSTVNTVRTENEQISESVNEVEENVRKLLDIYEMVTRGVNPFADDIEPGMGGMGNGGDSFGLFSDDDSGGDEMDEMDEDIATADAEGFFDEDLVEEDDSMDADGDINDVLGGGEEDTGDGDAFQESFDEGFDEDDDFDDDEFEMDDFGMDGDDEFEMENDETEGDEAEEDSSGGTSFADLKDEYESGEADWADDVEVGEDEDESDIDSEDDDGEGDGSADAFADDELFDEVLGDASDEDEPSGEFGEEIDDLTEETDSSEKIDESTSPEEPEESTSPEEIEETRPELSESSAEDSSTVSETPVQQDEPATEEEDSTHADDGKPYLRTLPSGFASELLVIEWLEFLVDEAGIRETSEAITYYRSIDWISEDVAEDLQTYLQGFEETKRGTLTIDHHTETLQYISQLDSGGVGLGQLTGGGMDGIQR